MKKLMISAVCAMMAAATFAEPSVEITEAYQQTPGSGIVNYTYKISDLGGEYYDLRIKVGAKGAASREIVIEDVSEGTVTTSVNAKELLGKAYPNVTLYATLENCVQLWANGPYFAKCNVGAKKPKDAGYYFWWGGTVGYTHDGEKWVSVDGQGTTITFSNTYPANTLYNKNLAALADYLDGNGNLKPGYDAATVHLGAPWRMPTESDWQGLLDNCTIVEKKDATGKTEGFVITGNAEGYKDRSIFLLAAGHGVSSTLPDYGSAADYWCSNPKDDVFHSQILWIGISDHSMTYASRCDGDVIRPVRDAK